MLINIFPLLNWPGKPVEKEGLNDKLLPYPLFCHYESANTSLDCLFICMYPLALCKSCFQIQLLNNYAAAGSVHN